MNSRKRPASPGGQRRRSKNPAADRSETPVAGGPQRLQRVLALAGLGSRRECEKLIVEGRVEIDGRVVEQLGVKADPARQEIRVDGERLKLPRLEYHALNKPPGVVSTSRDPAGRPRVIDLVHSEQRLYNVGRLDKSSEGLILVTNDGDLADRLTHPKYGVPKVYQVRVVGEPTRDELGQLERGVYLAEGVARATRVRVKKRRGSFTDLEIELTEGRNREIRRMLARAGHKVVRLRRIAIGPLTIGNLPLGAHRSLSASEVAQLKRAAEVGAARSGRRPSRSTAARGTKATRGSASPRRTPSSRQSGAPGSQKPAASTHGRGRTSKTSSPTRTKQNKRRR